METHHEDNRRAWLGVVIALGIAVVVLPTALSLLWMAYTIVGGYIGL